MSRTRATWADLQTKIAAIGRALNLIRFGARQTQRAALPPRPGAGAGLYAGTFIANKGRTVFKRAKVGDKRAGRLLIAPVHGPSIPREFGRKALTGSLEAAVLTRWRVELAAQLKYYIGKLYYTMPSAFDSANYTTREPDQLVAGDRWAWKRSDLAADYPLATHALSTLAPGVHRRGDRDHRDRIRIRLHRGSSQRRNCHLHRRPVHRAGLHRPHRRHRAGHDRHRHRGGAGQPRYLGRRPAQPRPQGAGRDRGGDRIPRQQGPGGIQHRRAQPQAHPAGRPAHAARQIPRRGARRDRCRANCQGPRRPAAHRGEV
ncbi:MAG: hypothetical protein MZW92_31785 [Comamonadaceae bacterium]|nr:hypothetical protein [Comamonadaceae bacterium]